MAGDYSRVRKHEPQETHTAGDYSRVRKHEATESIATIYYPQQYLTGTHSYI